MDTPRFVTEAVKRQCEWVNLYSDKLGYRYVFEGYQIWFNDKLSSTKRFMIGWTLHGWWHARRLEHLRKPTMERTDIEECHLAESMMDESRWFAEGKL